LPTNPSLDEKNTSFNTKIISQIKTAIIIMEKVIADIFKYCAHLCLDLENESLDKRAN
jgi:hypothetical protein